MHCYATDSDEKRIIHGILVVLSIGAAFGLATGLEALNLKAPWWIELPSFMGFYGLFHTIFDQWLWRRPLLRKVGLVKTPDLNGNWKGYVKSSFDEYAAEQSAALKISQSWTSMVVILETENSQSQSVSASVLTKNPRDVRVSYEYLNQPRPAAKDTMHAHRGTASLLLSEVGSSRVLEGEYYTGRDRRNYGSLHFELQDEKWVLVYPWT